MQQFPPPLDYERVAVPAGSRFMRAIAMPVCIAGMTLPLGLLAYAGDAGFGPVVAALSGYAFRGRPLLIGGALDQPSLHKEAFIFCFSVVVLCPFIVLVRLASSYCPRVGRFIFAIASLVILLHPLSILTIFTYDVVRYVHRMGWTEMRLTGLVLAAVAYLVIALLAAWICGAMRRT